MNRYHIKDRETGTVFGTYNGCSRYEAFLNHAKALGFETVEAMVKSGYPAHQFEAVMCNDRREFTRRMFNDRREASYDRPRTVREVV